MRMKRTLLQCHFKIYQMKKIISGLVLLLGLCNVFGQTDAEISQAYLEKHLAITSIKARVLSNSEYVVEITLKDYAGTAVLPAGFGSGDRVYADDGRGYDLVRADGIFTTKEKYTFKTDDRTNLESDRVIYDPNFQHKSAVEGDPNLQAKIKFTCKFAKVGCPPPNGGNCPACRYWGWSCWELQQCDVGVEF